MDNSRIIKGFDYFWNKKPSNFNSKDVALLHVWMSLFKPRMEEIRVLKTAEKEISTEPLTNKEMEVAHLIFES